MELALALAVIAMIALLGALAGVVEADSRVFPERTGETNAWL
jgi:hypothetical protein